MPRAVAGLLSILLAVSAHAEICQIVDAFTPAAEVALETRGQPADAQAAAFADKVIARFPALYQPGVIGDAAGSKRDAKIVASLDTIRAGSPVEATMASVRQQLPDIEAIFKRTFPDFRCDFAIYLMDSLGTLDGAGRIVGGRKSLVIGIDALAGEDAALRSVFLTHEFFHRYHAQAADFSDDAGEDQLLWRVLWAEGLATYASLKLTPGATPAQALMLPTDLETRAGPQAARIVGLLEPHLDQVDVGTYRLLFTYGGPAATDAGLPWRSGYYIGYRVAAELGRTRSVAVLAHLHGRRLRRLIGAALDDIARHG